MLTRKMLNELADSLGPTASWPTQIEAWADAISHMNPRFDRDRFVRRAMDAWEKNYNPPNIEDEIPH